MKNSFNYIVPIFNKEDILPQTLLGIENCATPESKIILIVDGCTDLSESIVDEFMKNSSHKVEKILMPNVHMLLSVNAGLARVKDGYSIIMQDDIILKDVDTERKIIELYESKNDKLGVVSFRYGADLKPTSFYDTLRINKSFSMTNKSLIKNFKALFKTMIEVTNVIQSPDDNANYIQGDYGTFYERMCAINGPNVIPFDLLSKIGKFDENIAPYGYDDPEFCLRSLKAGFINGLFPIKYISEEGWSGSSRSQEFKNNANRILTKSRVYVWDKHKDYFTN
jgi:glycosyltransferase involved in cell wall biosynthesis